MHTLLHSVPPTLQQATTNPCLCRRLLDTHGQVWVSLLWGHCSFLLGPGVHKVLFMPSISSVLCKFWQLYGGVNGDLLQEGLCHTQVCCTQSPSSCGSPLLTCTSTGDAQQSSVSVSVGSLGPGAHKVLFVPSKSLFPQSHVSSGSSMVGLMETSSREAYAISRSAAPTAPAPVAGHC